MPDAAFFHTPPRVDISLILDLGTKALPQDPHSFLHRDSPQLRLLSLADSYHLHLVR
jgi:hypothetical protein